MLRSTAILLVAAATLPAQVWTEVGDAGDRIDNPNVTIGDGPLTRIDGNLGAGTINAFDVDLYLIQVDDPQTFRASTVGGATFDTQLWLFDRAGHGIAFRDDDPGALQSTLTGQFLAGPGHVLLGVSFYDNDARDAAFQELWLDQPYATERQPDGPATGPLFQWNANTFNTPGGSYSIVLAGATFAGPSTPSGTDVAWAFVEPPPFTSAHTFVPVVGRQHTPTGELITVRHTGVGRYEVALPGSLPDTEATFQASAVGGNHMVVIQTWFPQNGKLSCHVAVSDATGAPTDAAFTLHYRGAGAPDDQAAFVWANDPTASSYTPMPAYSWNGNRADPTVVRWQTGSYYVTVPGVANHIGTIAVTPFSSYQSPAAHRASFGSVTLSAGSLVVEVVMRGASGLREDSRFLLSYRRNASTSPPHLGTGAMHYRFNGGPTGSTTMGNPLFCIDNCNHGPTNYHLQNNLGSGRVRLDIPSIRYSDSAVPILTTWDQVGDYGFIDSWYPYPSGNGVSFEVRTQDNAGTPTHLPWMLSYDTDDPDASAARNRIVGAGCHGLTLTANGRPSFGAQWTWAVGGYQPATQLPLTLIGTASLQVPLDLLGAPGCTAYLDPLDLRLQGSGLFIPSTAALIGFDILAQGVALGGGLNAFDIVTSNAVRGTIGDV